MALYYLPQLNTTSEPLFLMKKFFLSLFLSFVISLLFAQPTITCCLSQKTTAGNVVLATAEGKWNFSSPVDGIIKVIYQPNSYLKNELTSNAVIAKSTTVSISVSVKTDTLINFRNSSSIKIKNRKLLFQFNSSET